MRAAKVDANQADIILALKRVGVSVEIIGRPVDLLLCHRGETILMEVKTSEGRYTKEQVEFMDRWPGRILVAHSPEGAVRLVLGEKVMA